MRSFLTPPFTFTVMDLVVSSLSCGILVCLRIIISIDIIDGLKCLHVFLVAHHYEKRYTSENPISSESLGCDQMNRVPYAFNSLIYVEICRQPDIFYAISVLGRYLGLMMSPIR